MRVQVHCASVSAVSNWVTSWNYCVRSMDNRMFAFENEIPGVGFVSRTYVLCI
jgi:hypothetical protein